MISVPRKWIVDYIINGKDNKGESIQAVAVNLRRFWTPDMCDSLAKLFMSMNEIEMINKIDELERELAEYTGLSPYNDD